MVPLVSCGQVALLESLRAIEAAPSVPFHDVPADWSSGKMDDPSEREPDARDKWPTDRRGHEAEFYDHEGDHDAPREEAMEDDDDKAAAAAAPKDKPEAAPSASAPAASAAASTAEKEEDEDVEESVERAMAAAKELIGDRGRVPAHIMSPKAPEGDDADEGKDGTHEGGGDEGSKEEKRDQAQHVASSAPPAVPPAAVASAPEESHAQEKHGDNLGV